jgi:VCBS repeat-containing protein
MVDKDEKSIKKHVVNSPSTQTLNAEELLGIQSDDPAEDALKAKQWYTEQRLVDDASFQGDLHFGTKTELDFTREAVIEERDTSAVSETLINYDLDIRTAVIDAGGSDEISSVVVKNLPEGVKLSAGILNDDNTWTLNTSQLDALKLHSESAISDDLNINIVATATPSDDGNNSTTTTIATIVVPTEAIITGEGGTVIEDTTQFASGQLTIVDPDTGEDHFIAEIIDGTYGSLTVNEDGTWIYTLNNDADNVQQLATGDTVNDTITVKAADGTTHDLVMTVSGTNDVPIITDNSTINITEESMEGFTGYGEIWEGDVYSIVTQEEMLEHLSVSDVDSDSFTISLANAAPAWHGGIEANDSIFISDTLASESSNFDEAVIQITQEFLDNYPSVEAEVGDFYFDHVDFDKLSEGETANITFSIQVSDGESTSEPQNFNIQITGSNDTPIVSGNIILPNGMEDNPHVFSTADLLANSSDIDINDSLSVDNVSVDPEYGTVTDKGDGTYLFTPKADFNGEVSITYNVTDGIEIVPTSATLKMAAVNDNPIAVDDVYKDGALLNPENIGTQTDGAASGIRVTGIYAKGSNENLLDGKDELLTLNNHNYFDHGSLGHTGYNYMGGHDWFEDNGISLRGLRGGIITFEDGTQGVIDASSNGVARDRDGDGTIDYEENAYIYYNAYEPLGELETLEDTSLIISQDTLLANDSDIDSSTLSITGVGNATNGSVALNDDGTITFTPDDNFSGNATFTYTVDDNQGGTDSATVALSIKPDADEPEITVTAASGDEDTTIALDINAALVDTDGSEELGQITIQGVPDDAALSAGQQNNDGSWILNQDELEGLTVTPGTNNHQDFTLEISATSTDANGDKATTTVELPVTVNSINDTPDAVDDQDNGLLDSDNHGAQTDGAESGIRVTGIYANGSDENLLDGKDELLTLNSHNYFDHGSLGHTGYNYMGGHDWFEDNGISLRGLRGGIITFEDGTQGIIDASSNGVARDRDGDGTIDYEENAYIYYNAYEPLGELETLEDTSLIISQDTLLANDTDVDGDTLSITAVSENVVDDDGNVVGTAIQNEDGNIIFTPGDALDSLAEGESQEVSFTYTISDGHGGTDSATVGVVVTGTNDAPVIGDSVDLGEIKEGSGIKFAASDLLKNTTDVDGDKLSILNVSVDKEFGSIEYSTDKEGNVETVKFLPAENFIGEDVPINFVAADGQVKVEGKATIDVTGAEKNDLMVGKLIDGGVEGIEYTTTSGLHGYTEEGGSFSFLKGDDVTFNIGGVTLGTATFDDIASGQTFLQDIADVDRTDLNDEYLENMATLLQSIDENSDAYDGIVVTDEIREALVDVDLDLRTASEEDVQQVVEQLGKNYVEEDAAMDHVEDMLVEHTDLEHNEFDKHVDDGQTEIKQAIGSDENEESKNSVLNEQALSEVEEEAALDEEIVKEESSHDDNFSDLDRFDISHGNGDVKNGQSVLDKFEVSNGGNDNTSDGSSELDKFSVSDESPTDGDIPVMDDMDDVDSTEAMEEPEDATLNDAEVVSNEEVQEPEIDNDDTMGM